MKNVTYYVYIFAEVQVIDPWQLSVQVFACNSIFLSKLLLPNKFAFCNYFFYELINHVFNDEG